MAEHRADDGIYEALHRRDSNPQREKTNRQWLESMTDEELACWLDSHIESCAVCSHLTSKGCEIPNNGYDCLRGRLNWLRMEHKERKE